MNPIAEEIASYLGCSENEEAIAHYGVKRRSGRYPWGSGENPYQHSADFLARVESLAKEGKAEKDIAKELGMTTTDLRMQVRVAKHERRALEADRARSLREDGLSLQEIANKMGYTNDSSIRSLLNENTAENKNRANVTAETIAKELENYSNCGYLSKDKIWTDKTMVVNKNGIDYTIIEQGTPLITGYVIKVLPMSARTEQEKAERQAPPIYVVIADQYGIRAITVNGEII